jgi:hypothetical protein
MKTSTVQQRVCIKSDGFVIVLKAYAAFDGICIHFATKLKVNKENVCEHQRNLSPCIMQSRSLEL